MHGRSRRTIALLGEFARDCADKARVGKPIIWYSRALPYKDYDEIYSDMKRLAETFKLPPPVPPNVLVKR